MFLRTKLLQVKPASFETVAYASNKISCSFVSVSLGLLPTDDEMHVSKTFNRNLLQKFGCAIILLAKNPSRTKSKINAQPSSDTARDRYYWEGTTLVLFISLAGRPASDVTVLKIATEELSERLKKKLYENPLQNSLLRPWCPCPPWVGIIV